MINILKNKYLPLKNTKIDYKTERYLIKKIDCYLLNIKRKLVNKLILVDNFIKEGYTKDEAKSILGIDTLTLTEYNLNRIKENLLTKEGLNNYDVVILNKIYKKNKTTFINEYINRLNVGLILIALISIYKISHPFCRVSLIIAIAIFLELTVECFENKYLKSFNILHILSISMFIIGALLLFKLVISDIISYGINIKNFF